MLENCSNFSNIFPVTQHVKWASLQACVHAACRSQPYRYALHAMGSKNGDSFVLSKLQAPSLTAQKLKYELREVRKFHKQGPFFTLTFKVAIAYKSFTMPKTKEGKQFSPWKSTANHSVPYPKSNIVRVTPQATVKVC